MNKSNPIIPPESVLSVLYGRRSRKMLSLPFIVFTVLALHIMFLGGFLVQGCKHVEKSAKAAPPNSAVPTDAPLFASELALVVQPEAQLPVAYAAAESRSGAAQEAAVGSEPKSNESTAAASYVVKSGDTLGRIAKMNKTTVKLLRSVNRLNSDRLSVGQTLARP